MLDGLIAGDGYMRRGVQSGLSVTGKYEEWIDHIAARLTEAGMQVRRKNYAANSFHATVETAAYASLRVFRDRWYPQGKKCLPPDLVIAPDTLLYWYLGDGSLKGRDRSPSIELSTYAFSPSSVVVVARSIQSAAGLSTIRVYLDRRGPWISVATRDVRRFLDYIGPTPVRCYSYKWAVPPLPPGRRSHRSLTDLSPEQLMIADRCWVEKRPFDADTDQDGVTIPDLQRAVQGPPLDDLCRQMLEK